MQSIHNFMITGIISVDAQTSCKDAAKMLCEKKISSLLVKEGEEYVGIITKSDLIRKVMAEGLDSNSTNVQSIMSQPLLSKDEYVLRSEANEFMLRSNIKHLVVTKGKNVVGILTYRNLVS